MSNKPEPTHGTPMKVVEKRVEVPEVTFGALDVMCAFRFGGETLIKTHELRTKAYELSNGLNALDITGTHRYLRDEWLVTPLTATLTIEA